MANTTDISLVSNVIQITYTYVSPNSVTTVTKNNISKPAAQYSFDAAGTILALSIGNYINTKYYSIPLSELRISGSGTAPATAAAALTSLAALFPA